MPVSLAALAKTTRFDPAVSQVPARTNAAPGASSATKTSAR
jgi:hypothetical protein